MPLSAGAVAGQAYGGGYTGEDVLKTITWQDNVPYLVAWNKLYRREVFRTLRYPVGRINEDVFVFAELFDTIKMVACVEQPLYFYRQRTGSICAIWTNSGAWWNALIILWRTGTKNCSVRRKSVSLQS